MAQNFLNLYDGFFSLAVRGKDQNRIKCKEHEDELKEMHELGNGSH